MTASDGPPAARLVTRAAKSQLDSARTDCQAQTPESSPGFGHAGPSSGPARQGASPKTEPRPTRCLNRRVDALVVAYQLDVDDAVNDEVGERQAIADLVGTAELRVSDFAFAMKATRKREAFWFENADVRCSYDQRATAGWKLEVTLRAAFLAAHTLASAIALAKRIARGFGSVVAERLRRFDLAADFEGFPLEQNDIEHIATTRAAIASFSTQRKDTDEVSIDPCRCEVTEYRSATHEVTGFSIAQGNPLMARVYDKTAELALQGREQKRAIEHAIWQNHGWDGATAVTRVEFQLRGDVLDEIRLRNPSDLESSLDATWSMCTRWLRFIDPETATRQSRCKLDRRWQAVVDVVFIRDAPPITRTRNRGGASPSHVVGAVRSRLAANGQLQRIAIDVGEDGKPLSETEFVEGLTETDAMFWVHNYMNRLFPEAGHDAARSILQQYGPRGAVAHLMAKHNAKVARFSSADDDRTEERKSRP